MNTCGVGWVIGKEECRKEGSETLLETYSLEVMLAHLVLTSATYVRLQAEPPHGMAFYPSQG